METIVKAGPRAFTCTRCINRYVASLKRSLPSASKCFIHIVLSLIFASIALKTIFMFFCGFLVISFQEELIIVSLKRQMFPDVGSEVHNHFEAI